MKQVFYILIILFTTSSCQSQSKKTQANKVVGGPCEGCDAIYEYGNKKLTATDTLPGFQENQPKLKIVGIVYESDGTTPAENVILYIYHTNRKGIYETKENDKGWARRHGFIRGWIKTGKNGKYEFFTFRPASYPDQSEPEHIHITVKERDKNEYYIDSYVFNDDPLLKEAERNGLDNRGGSGIVIPETIDGILTVKRDIILGLNIPDYE